jgi:hypothetical protein
MAERLNNLNERVAMATVKKEETDNDGWKLSGVQSVHPKQLNSTGAAVGVSALRFG